MKIERAAIADFVTLANGFVGLLAIMYIFDGEFKYAMMLILLGVLIDGADGILARFFGREKRYGVYLDSIADMVTFCFAPAILLYGKYYDLSKGTSFQNLDNALTVAASMLVVLFGILRLARYIEEGHKKKNFIGLPIPAAAVVIVLLVAVFTEQYVILIVTIVISFLMISSLPYPKLQGISRGIAGITLVVGMFALWFEDDCCFYLLVLTLLLAIIYVVIGPLYAIKYEGE